MVFSNLMYRKAPDFKGNGTTDLGDLLPMHWLYNFAIVCDMVYPTRACLLQIRELFFRLSRRNTTHRDYWREKYPSFFKAVHACEPRFAGSRTEVLGREGNDGEQIREASLAEMKQLRKDIFRTLCLMEALLLEWEENLRA